MIDNFIISPVLPCLCAAPGGISRTVAGNVQGDLRRGQQIRFIARASSAMHAQLTRAGTSDTYKTSTERLPLGASTSARYDRALPGQMVPVMGTVECRLPES